MADNDHGAQSDLRLRLEATADLISEGVSLGEISARAPTVTQQLVALRSVVERIVSDAHPATTAVLRALLPWAESVEARLAGHRAVSAGETAALERAGEALGQRDLRRPPPPCREHAECELTPDHDRPCMPGGAPLEAERDDWPDDQKERCTFDQARACTCESSVYCPARPRAAVAVNERASQEMPAETCKRCGKPVKVNGRLRSCAPCSMSWIAPLNRAPLAQSAWVPAEAEEPLGPQEFCDKGKPSVQTVTERIRELEGRNAYLERVAGTSAEAGVLRERIRELEAEVERLKDAEPESDDGRLSVAEEWLRELLREATSMPPPPAGGLRTAALELLGSLRHRRRLGMVRVSFNLAEVLP